MVYLIVWQWLELCFCKKIKGHGEFQFIRKTLTGLRIGQAYAAAGSGHAIPFLRTN